PHVPLARRRRCRGRPARRTGRAWRGCEGRNLGLPGHGHHGPRRQRVLLLLRRFSGQGHAKEILKEEMKPLTSNARLLFLTVCMVLFWVAGDAQAAERELHWDSLDVDARLAADGVLDVTERHA